MNRIVRGLISGDARREPDTTAEVSGCVTDFMGSKKQSQTPFLCRAGFQSLCNMGDASHSQQNHRMVGVGRALWGSPSPTPCPSRVTQSRLHSTASRRGWNISREGDSTASLGSLGQGSITLRGKKFFLMFSAFILKQHSGQPSTASPWVPTAETCLGVKQSKAQIFPYALDAIISFPVGHVHNQNTQI